MTIRFKAHVHSLTNAGQGRITVALATEARRSLEPITVEADKTEIGNYRPGTVVEVAITPTGE